MSSTTFADGIPLTQRVALEKQAAAVIGQLEERVRSLETALRESNAKVASYERRERAWGLARTMEDKGLLSNRTFDEKVAHILKHEDLSHVAHAVDLATDGGTKIAQVSELPEAGVSAQEACYHFFLTGETLDG